MGYRLAGIAPCNEQHPRETKVSGLSTDDILGSAQTLQRFAFEPDDGAMSKILIIDDDMAVNELLGDVVARMGHDACSAVNAQQGLAMAEQDRFDLILLDVGLPDGDGLKILPRIRETDQAPEVIIITGNGNPDAAEMAIKNGAWDYLVKPSSVDNIMLAIQRALAYHSEKCTNPPPRILKRDDIIGESASLNAVLERIAQAAASESNILICGRTGTGKELFARAIHDNGSRSRHPFVVVDCAALPETLVESVLFGHAKGAFTGADKERQGLIQQAHGGTLFLDEVGELPLSLQKAFLRVIQERSFRPVSGRREIQVNFRLIAATNRDLETMTAQGSFRSDLLFRLRSFSIDAPPLKQRQGDIRRLTLYYVNRLCEIYDCEVKGLSNDYLDALEQYAWPGNVRELFNAIEESISLAANEPTLRVHHLPVRLRASITRHMVKQCVPPQHGATDLDPVFPHQGPFPTINAFRDLMERRYLDRLLRLTQGNRKEACRISGLSRTRLFELLKKYDLAGPGREKSRYLRGGAGRESVMSSFNCHPAPGGP
jgi:two-component system, NtrC family, response regulator